MMKRLSWAVCYLVVALCTACGVEPEADESDLHFVTGAGPFRGHEDITRMGVDRANSELERLFGQRPFPVVAYGLNAVDTDNPLIKGNYESDWPSDRLRNFYGAMGADWHNDGRLQPIHSLRGSQNGAFRNNFSSCRVQQETIRAATSKSLVAFKAGDRDEGLYWAGHATHIIQDSFSAAHVDRNERQIKEFCSYGTEFPGICYHQAVDDRDYIWHEGISCNLDPTNREESCLRRESLWAMQATTGYLSTLGRMINSSMEQMDALLQDYFVNAEVDGYGYFNCDTIPNLPFGLSQVKIESGNSSLSLCSSNWKAAEDKRKLSGNKTDLNDGAFGKYINLCQQYGETPSPITGISVAGSDGICPAGYERDSHNLNEGVVKSKVKPLYLCVSRQPGPPLLEIAATSDKNGGNRCGEGWNWIGVDLNQSAGGNYVFLCYR